MTSLGEQRRGYNYSGFLGAALPPVAALEDGCEAGWASLVLNSSRLIRPSRLRSMAIQLPFLASGAASSSLLR
jgi:hypothetical protein